MKFQPADSYDALLKQARAMQQLLISTQAQLSVYRKKDDSISERRLAQLELSLASEQEMNVQLTKEIIHLEAQQQKTSKATPT
jgi:hypothetical protein